MTPQTIILKNKQAEGALNALLQLSKPYTAITPDEKATLSRPYPFSGLVLYQIARNINALREVVEKRSKVQLELARNTVGEGVDLKDAPEDLRNQFIKGFEDLMEEEVQLTVLPLQFAFEKPEGKESKDVIGLDKCPIPSAVLADLINTGVFQCSEDSGETAGGS